MGIPSYLELCNIPHFTSAEFVLAAVGEGPLCISSVSALSVTSHPPLFACLASSVGFASDWCSEGCWFNILLWRLMMQYIFYSHSLPLIQDEQLLVSGERMCTILVNHLED